MTPIARADFNRPRGWIGLRAPRVRATGGKATADAAEGMQALVRRTEYISSGMIAYRSAITHQVDGGFGYLLLETRYTSDKSFDQDAYFRAAPDPRAVYLDPDAKEPDGSDAEFGFVFESVPRDRFNREHRKFKDRVGKSTLGSLLVASSAKGVAAILIGDDIPVLVAELRASFPDVALRAVDDDRLIGRVVGLVEDPSGSIDLPLDIRGTPFQQKVWAALRTIPAGATATYSDLAARVGDPKAVRAVASACAANKLAVAIPCHRVLRTDGSLSGYRWGVERKRALI